MKAIPVLARIFTKILEVCHLVAAALMAAAGLCSVIAPQWLGFLTDVSALQHDPSIAVYGLEVTTADGLGGFDTLTFVLFAVGGVILFVLMAMIFRNLFLIFKRSEKESPFCPDNIRMLREIGIFSIAMPVVGLVMSILIRLIAGEHAAETSVSLSGFVMGIVVLCLTRFFTYGAELEQDVEGLV